MKYRTVLAAGALFAGLGVLIGAFGAHQLKPMLTEMGRAETFELAVRYQFYHAFALLITGILMKHGMIKLKWAGICFAGGILFFSGSLYALCFTGVKILGAITPIGGVLFIVGWIILLVSVLRRSPHPRPFS
jgi:uncharacterized membrane protein YgdD (TMEM256/DUF423 family)